MGRGADLLAGGVAGAVLGALFGALLGGPRGPGSVQPERGVRGAEAPPTGRLSAPRPAPRAATENDEAALPLPRSREARRAEAAALFEAAGSKRPDLRRERPREEPRALSEIEELKSEDPKRRIRALESLVALHDSIEDAIRAAIHDPDPSVRAAALSALAEIAGEEAIAELFRALRKDESPSVRVEAIEELTFTLDDAVIRPLGNALANDPDPLVRKAAAQGLSVFADKRAIDALARAAESDSDGEVRRVAMAARERAEKHMVETPYPDSPEVERAREAIQKAIADFFSRRAGAEASR